MRHFTFTEMTASETARRLGLRNMPQDILVFDWMDTLIENVLEPLRRAMGFPIIISSGYRCPELNEKVGGVPNSLHVLGRAADIDCGRTRNRKVYEWLQQQRQTGRMNIKELLYEGNGKWIHVAI